MQLQPAAGRGHGAQPTRMPAAAALTSGAAEGEAAVEAAAAEAAQLTAAHPGERPATGRKLDIKAGMGTDSATNTPGTVAPTATAAVGFRGEAEAITDTG
jgi:hypothetical protein